MGKFQFPNQTDFYRGKVRDVYTINHETLVMVASDRISAFDVVLPRNIPYKGQVLNQIAAYMLQATEDVCTNWLQVVPVPDVSIGRKCSPFKIEMVVRGNLTGHAWRLYKDGIRVICGNEMPVGMKEYDFFPQPLITPTTKAAEGHDDDISANEIIDQQLTTAQEWEELCLLSLKLFERGQQLASDKGLILADTKYEFGKINNEIILMDEIHTPDSSRYFYAEGFHERQQKKEKQVQLSKEFVREWLIDNNFMGKAGQIVPEMTDAWVQTISNKYIGLYEIITGKKFLPSCLSFSEKEKQILDSLEKM